MAQSRSCESNSSSASVISTKKRTHLSDLQYYSVSKPLTAACFGLHWSIIRENINCCCCMKQLLGNIFVSCMCRMCKRRKCCQVVVLYKINVLPDDGRAISETCVEVFSTFKNIIVILMVCVCGWVCVCVCV
jgi:hypothetical protein